MKVVEKDNGDFQHMMGVWPESCSPPEMVDNNLQLTVYGKISV
jgi:hypothetical protein